MKTVGYEKSMLSVTDFILMNILGMILKGMSIRFMYRTCDLCKGRGRYYPLLAKDRIKCEKCGGCGVT
jgi:hypothetical protein